MIYILKKRELFQKSSRGEHSREGFMCRNFKREKETTRGCYSYGWGKVGDVNKITKAVFPPNNGKGSGEKKQGSGKVLDFHF